VDVLGIGPLELMFVILIALIIIGPKDMSKTARSAGRYLNRMYRSETWRTLTEASRTLQTLPNRLAREAQLEELEALRKDLDDTGSTAKPGVADNPALQPWVTPYNTPEPSKTIAPPKPAAAATQAATKPKTTPAPPAKRARPAKTSKVAAKPPSTAKKKSPASKSKSGGAAGKTKRRTASKSSSGGRSGSSRSKPAQRSGS
jgi:sec-independent protein translocase protein TatB